MKNIAESKRVRKLIRAKAKRCFHNAFRAIQDVSGYENADYVEGIAVLGGLMIEHGWVQKDGEVVDPTLPNHKVTYFPGLRFKGRRGLAEALKMPTSNGTYGLPFFYNFGWGGIDSPEYRAALIAAHRHLGMEEMATQYEEYEPCCEEKV